MNPQRLITLSLSAFGLFAAVSAHAASEVTLYKGDPISGGTMVLGGWGSGTAIQSQKYNFSGTNSIEINTDGYFAGGRIDFTPGVDLTDAFADRQTYLVLTVKFPGFGDEGDDIGGPSAGSFSGTFRGTTAPGQAYRGQSATDSVGPKMGYFRVVLTVNGQNLVAEDQPIDLRRTEGGWTTLSTPLAAFKGPRPAGGRMQVSRIQVFGDRPDQFYLGEIRTTIDEAEIFLEESPEEQTVSPFDPVQLTAIASGGLANFEYVWDFDKTDGLQEEAFGETVYHAYSIPGEYTATLRVRDINNVKPELREEFLVTIAQ